MTVLQRYGAAPIRGIYIIACSVSRRVYIGSSVSLTKRWQNHANKLRCGTHRNPHLQAAWNKYGADAFEWLVTKLMPCACSTKLHTEACRLELRDAERAELAMWVDVYNIAEPGVNPMHDSRALARMSASMKGWSPSPEQRAKMSAAKKGRKLAPEHRAKIALANTGRRYSPETRVKISIATLGRKHTPEARAKISAARRGTT